MDPQHCLCLWLLCLERRTVFSGLYKKINGYQASWALGAAFNLLEKWIEKSFLETFLVHTKPWHMIHKVLKLNPVSHIAVWIPVYWSLYHSRRQNLSMVSRCLYDCPKPIISSHLCFRKLYFSHLQLRDFCMPMLTPKRVKYFFDKINTFCSFRKYW